MLQRDEICGSRDVSLHLELLTMAVSVDRWCIKAGCCSFACGSHIAVLHTYIPLSTQWVSSLVSNPRLDIELQSLSAVRAKRRSLAQA